MKNGLVLQFSNLAIFILHKNSFFFWNIFHGHHAWLKWSTKRNFIYLFFVATKNCLKASLTVQSPVINKTAKFNYNWVAINTFSSCATWSVCHCICCPPLYEAYEAKNKLKIYGMIKSTRLCAFYHF